MAHLEDITATVLVAFVVIGSLAFSFAAMPPGEASLTGNVIALQNNRFAIAPEIKIEPTELVLPDSNPKPMRVNVSNRQIIWHKFYIIGQAPDGQPTYSEFQFAPMADTFPQKSATGALVPTGWILNNAGKDLSLDRTNLLSQNNFLFVYSCAKTDTGWDCHNNALGLGQWGYSEFSAKTTDLAISEVKTTTALPGPNSPLDISVTITSSNPAPKSLDKDVYLIIDWDSQGSPKAVSSVLDSSGAALALNEGKTTVSVPIKDFIAGSGTVTKLFKVTYSSGGRNMVVSASISPNDPVSSLPNILETDALNDQKSKSIWVGSSSGPSAVNYKLASIGPGTSDSFTPVTIPVALSREGGPADDASPISISFEMESGAPTHVDYVKYGLTTLTKDGNAFVLPNYVFGSKTSDTLQLTVQYNLEGTYAVKGAITNSDWSSIDNSASGTVTITGVELPDTPVTPGLGTPK